MTHRPDNSRSRFPRLAAGVLAALALASWGPVASAWQYDEEKDVPESVRAKGDEAVAEWMNQQAEQSLREKRQVAIERAKERDESRERAKAAMKRKAERMVREERERKERAVEELRKADEERVLATVATIALLAGLGFWWSRSRQGGATTLRQADLPKLRSASPAVPARPRQPLSSPAFAGDVASSSAPAAAPASRKVDAGPVLAAAVAPNASTETGGFSAFLPGPGESGSGFPRVASSAGAEAPSAPKSDRSASDFDGFLPDEPKE